MANALKEFSRVAETSISTGTGAMTLAGALSGWRTFDSVLSNNQTVVVITVMGSDWEVALATYSTSTNSLARTQVYASTNSGSAVNWGGGTKTISILHPGFSDLDDAGRAALLEVMLSVSEVTVASASTCDILGAASPRVAISGTTTITSFGTGANKIRFVRFAGALTLTHNGTSLILPGAANIPTAAGDTCIVVSDGSSNARVIDYQRASGLPVIGPAEATDSHFAQFDGVTGKLLKGGKAAPSGTVVGTSDAQVLTNKTLNAASNTISNLATSMFAASVVDTDGTLAANSDTRLASQKAVKTYVDGIVAANDAMVFKGVIDCSSNPNYPAADRGHTYRVSVAGKIGGGSGLNVEVGDILLCQTDSTSAGNHATVGSAWSVIQTNLDGAVIGPASVTDGHVAQFDGTTGKLLKGGKAAPSGDFVGTSDSQTLTNKTLDAAVALATPAAHTDSTLLATMAALANRVRSAAGVTVADDEAGTPLITIPTGVYGVLKVLSGTSLHGAEFDIDTIGSYAMVSTPRMASTVENGGIGNASPGSGTDGKVTFYLNGSTGVVSVSNRSGGTQTFGAIFMRTGG
jgi:hypothetical protein